MANFELVMPKLGESIIEATIVRWHKKEGDQVTEDESIADLATDKVDSEIPSPVEGTVVKLLFKEGDVVPVGKVIAIINMGGEATAASSPAQEESKPLVSDTLTTNQPLSPSRLRASFNAVMEISAHKRYSYFSEYVKYSGHCTGPEPASSKISPCGARCRFTRM